jgi:hypothetical protein
MINYDEMSLHDMLLRCRENAFGQVSITGRNPSKETYCIRLTPEDLQMLITKTLKTR